MTKLLRLPEVLEITALSRSGLYSLLSKGDFPQPIKLGERINAWRDDQLQEWLEARTPARVEN